MKTGDQIVIVNAILTNNGDAALVIGLQDALIMRGYKVDIVTMNHDKIASRYPEAQLHRDIRSKKLLIKLPFLKSLFFLPSLKKLKAYQNATVLLGCPGGYMNSYYGIKDRLAVFRACARDGKKVAIYSQSFGPFNRGDKRRMHDGQRFILKLLCRDLKSVDNLKDCEIHKDKIIFTNDAAFLLKPISSKMEKGKVAVSVREWKRDGRSDQHYKMMIKGMVEILVNRGFEVDMLSTCQGIPGYVDDSEMAEDILKLLPKETLASVKVDANYYTLNQLREKLRSYEIVVGTRLHMCILAMLSGVPAMNISYEFKGLELYRQLDISKWSVDYNHQIDIAFSRLDQFISQREELAVRCAEMAAKEHEKAHAFLDEFISELP